MSNSRFVLYNIEEVISELDKMLLDGIVDTYAIGGAIAASLYGEVATTEDVDVFVLFKNEESSILIDPTPVIRYFTGKGYKMLEDKVVIGGWPVQFLPPPTSLEEDALRNAIILQDGGLKIRVISQDYVAAIALSTGRSKDRNRLIQLREEGKLDMQKFDAIVSCHGLSDKWMKFQTQFPQDAP